MKEIIKNIFLFLGIYYPIHKMRFGINHKMISFYSGLISFDDIVFDVGANIGNRTDIFCKICKNVIAIEPQPYCVTHLRSRYRWNKKVKIESVALNSKEGITDLYLNESHTMSSMSEIFINEILTNWKNTGKWNKKITVKTKTLDQLIINYGVPKFIKIDVEGFEINVLNGLSHPVKLISFEYTPGLWNETLKCLERLNQISKNYYFNYCLEEIPEFMLSKPHNLEDFITHDIPDMKSHNKFGDIYAILIET